MLSVSDLMLLYDWHIKHNSFLSVCRVIVFSSAIMLKNKK